MKQTVRTLIILLLLLTLLPLPAQALQNFYGEGNVLIAVDMGPYGENDDVSYREGTMGSLVWGDGAPTGESTRPAFDNHPYIVSPDVKPPHAPEYAIETTYHLGQTVLFPYYRNDDPAYVGWGWWEKGELPPELFDADGAPRFLIHSSCTEAFGGERFYYLPAEQTGEDDYRPCVDYLEIECVAVTAYSTVWQYTGVAYSDRTGFDLDDYEGAVCLTDTEIQYFIDTCDEAYTVQGQIYGDPRWEDQRGDRDGKAAYIVLDIGNISTAGAFYSSNNTDMAGFDSLVINASELPERRVNAEWKAAEDSLSAILIHELNHYIVTGCIGHEGGWNMWVGEAFAESAKYAVQPENISYIDNRGFLRNDSSRLRLIPGMLWSYDVFAAYPVFIRMPYTLGPYFLRYIERETTGEIDGRLWTGFFAHQTPTGSIAATELDSYLSETTGEGLDAWMARFMAAVVVGAADGAYCMGDETITKEYSIDPYVFFRPYTEYGSGLSFDGAADDAIRVNFQEDYAFSAVQGGGTSYAWRNDAGGKIAVTDADDRWYFFAVNMDLPDGRGVIEIGSAAELAKIGRDPDYSRYGTYLLTADLDLGGAEAPWTPIGTDLEPFAGVFDGNGHTIRGLYIDDPDNDNQGLFGIIVGNAEIRDLTVYGSVIGEESVGGIVGRTQGGTVRGCNSHVTVTGRNNAGGIAGHYFCGTIENCTASGSVTGAVSIGGISGSISYVTIRNCRGTGVVTGDESVGGIAGYCGGSIVSACSLNGNVTGDTYVGGIAGFCDQSAVSACSMRGNLAGDRYVGGIVGRCYSSSTFSECRNAGCVTGVDSVGGIAGFLTGDVSLRNCYHTGTVSGERLVGALVGDGFQGDISVETSYSYQPDLPAVGELYEGSVTACYLRSETERGEGFLTTAEFAQQSSFEGWDFETVWDLSGGVRPVLQSNRENIPVPDPDDPDGPAPSPAPKPDEPAPVAFADVAESDWFYDAVQYVAQKGLFLGTGGDAFSPRAPMTRGMCMAVLARMAGETVDGENWQAQAVAWATANAVSDGSSPDAPITREQLVTMLWRACGAPAGNADLSGFTDAGIVSDWAMEAMRWAVGVGLVQGMGAGTLSPDGSATRAQTAVLIHRFSEIV